MRALYSARSCYSRCLLYFGLLKVEGLLPLLIDNSCALAVAQACCFGDFYRQQRAPWEQRDVEEEGCGPPLALHSSLSRRSQLGRVRSLAATAPLQHASDSWTKRASVYHRRSTLLVQLDRLRANAPPPLRLTAHLTRADAGRVFSRSHCRRSRPDRWLAASQPTELHLAPTARPGSSYRYGGTGSLSLSNRHRQAEEQGTIAAGQAIQRERRAGVAHRSVSFSSSLSSIATPSPLSEPTLALHSFHPPHAD